MLHPLTTPGTLSTPLSTIEGESAAPLQQRQPEAGQLCFFIINRRNCRYDIVNMPKVPSYSIILCVVGFIQLYFYVHFSYGKFANWPSAQIAAKRLNFAPFLYVRRSSFRSSFAFAASFFCSILSWHLAQFATHNSSEPQEFFACSRFFIQFFFCFFFLVN